MSLWKTFAGASARLFRAKPSFNSFRQNHDDARRSLESSQSLPPFLLNKPPTRVTTLSNGLRVVSEASHGETVSVGVFINAGSYYESKQANGVAHFLEHMAFKGTSKWTRQQLELEVENKGSSLNAYTSREHTVFLAKVRRDELSTGVGYLGDLIKSPILAEEDIERERSVILREKEEIDSQIDEYMFDQLHATAFPNQALGFTILGPEENIKNIKQQDLKNYIKEHYTANRMILAASGAVDHEALVEAAKKSFSELKTSSSDFSPPSFNYYGAGYNQANDAEVASLIIAARSVGWSHPDNYAFMLLQSIIGNWDRFAGAGTSVSSRFGELVAEEQLAHSFSTFNTFYHDIGLFGIYATTPHSRIEDMTCEILTEWVRLSQRLSESELGRAKSRLKASLLMFDGCSAICDDLGRQMLTIGRRVTPAEIVKRIDSITASEVQKVAREYLTDMCPSFVHLGKPNEFLDYNQVRSWTHWHRL